MTRILVSGSSGLIGRALVPFLKEKGYEVTRLVRHREPAAKDTIYWNPLEDKADLASFEGFEAVFHLAGNQIAEGRWNKERKERIFLSRCRDTWLLSHIFSRLKYRPSFFFSASAVGYYGNQGDRVLKESEPCGKGFVADLCTHWERASQVLLEPSYGIRVVQGRLGIVLSPEGGMLKRVMPLFRARLGGKIGSGLQWMSWISLEDVLQALYFFLTNPKTSGVFNLTAPYPVTNAAFTKTLGAYLSVITCLPVPKVALHVFLGEMAKELLLSSHRVIPHLLQESGFMFTKPSLEDVLPKKVLVKI